MLQWAGSSGLHQTDSDQNKENYYLSSKKKTEFRKSLLFSNKAPISETKDPIQELCMWCDEKEMDCCVEGRSITHMIPIN